MRISAMPYNNPGDNTEVSRMDHHSGTTQVQDKLGVTEDISHY